MDLIRKYNGCFQMTSFGAKKIVTEGFMPTFKVQGQERMKEKFAIGAPILQTSNQGWSNNCKACSMKKTVMSNNLRPRLMRQFLVDIYAKIETKRLNFIRNHQKQLRAENYIHLKDAVGRNDVNATDLGQMVVLPSSFTGGPRYMHERTQDAMTYVRVHGRLIYSSYLHVTLLGKTS
ncbi:hypothetical protein AGLY_003866 [Aphis glycines]|uniref:Helitron helicase-like domain-containing protein n=1 Tax=Aphis glycines TaxID=307491 RepID=A0A6G0TZU0_APHGL|nr:hypothetical protein AGLY_003866 [Aphis glycines]